MKYSTEIHNLIKKLFPIHRSLTGDGVRETLREISALIPIENKSFKSGIKAYDWVVPQEWKFKSGQIKSIDGAVVLDCKLNNLQILQYSEPINMVVSKDELLEHLFYIPGENQGIPYRTSYYNRNWGFCVTEEFINQLSEPFYQVIIDSELFDGVLNYGELFIQGEYDDEILLSTYICHPSMANDNLSAVSIFAYCAHYLLEKSQNKLLKYSYRFLFIPETIGSISWLANNDYQKVFGGLVGSCLGDCHELTFKKSKKDSSYINKVIEVFRRDSEDNISVEEFEPFGSDERQYCSPGIDLDIAVISRSMYGRFKEYHTSKDDMSIINREALTNSFNSVIHILNIIDSDVVYESLVIGCEPMLSKYGLYNKVGGFITGDNKQQKLINYILSNIDGVKSVLDISILTKIPYWSLRVTCDKLVEVGILSIAGKVHRC
jgi:aminopeptidase-like protein